MSIRIFTWVRESSRNHCSPNGSFRILRKCNSGIDPDVCPSQITHARTRGEEDGTIRMNTIIDTKKASVTAMLERQDYEQAIQAHYNKALVILSGDFDHIGQR